MNPAFRPRSAAAGLVVLALAGCAPPEASAPLSDRVRTAPPPYLAPTATFDAPRAGGVDAGLRVAAERDALAARAEALRVRAAALSAAAVLEPDERAQIEARSSGAGVAAEPNAPEHDTDR